MVDWRTALTMGAQGTFFWAAIKPEQFAEAMRALALAPRPLWYIWGGTFGLYFLSEIIRSLSAPDWSEPPSEEDAKKPQRD